MIELEFDEELGRILDKYSENGWKDEPLDGDEVETLVEHLRNQLNYMNGNITYNEYIEMEEVGNSVKYQIKYLAKMFDIKYDDGFIDYVYNKDLDSFSGENLKKLREEYDRK